jgi:1-acyl-sn-glycerol-3-phosphate acyltransferase
MSPRHLSNLDPVPDAPTRFAVDEEAPHFWPARPGRFWSALLGPLSRWYARRKWQVTEVLVDGLEDVYARFSPRDGVLLAPNHSFEGDAHVLLEAARKIRRRFYFMADWRAFRGGWGIKGWILQRMGAFSINRDGSGRQSVRQAIDLLTSGQSLVVFPEGEIHHLNERLTPLLDGVAFMAHSAQQQLIKAGSDATIWIVPAAIRYRFAEDVRPKLEEAMTRLEKRMFWAKPPRGAPLRERILHFGDLLLTIKEKEKRGRSCESDGDMPARINLLIETLLSQQEAQYLNGPASGKTPALRVKALRRRLLDLCGDKETDEPTRQQARHALEDVQLALQLYSYPGNYITGDDAVEAMGETIEKLHEDIFGLCTPIARRRARILFGEPINLHEVGAAGRTRAIVEKGTDELEGRIDKLLARAGEGEW